MTLKFFYDKRLIDPFFFQPNFPLKVRLNGNIDSEEHAWVNPSFLRTIKAKDGQQVRIRVNGKVYGAVTVFAKTTVGKLNIEFSQAGIDRLKLKKGMFINVFAEFVNNAIPLSSLSTKNDYVEDSYIAFGNNSTTNILIMNPHGYEIEPETQNQALWAKQYLDGYGIDDYAMWRCFGSGDTNLRAYDRWHITSADLSLNSLPKLKTIIDTSISKNSPFVYGVTFHGQTANKITIGGIVGGGFKIGLKAALESATDGYVTVEIANPGDPLAGSAPLNICNRFSTYGIQLEQGLAIRQTYGQIIAETVMQFLLDTFA